MAAETGTAREIPDTAARVAARRLLDRYGSVAAARGAPVWLRLGGDPAQPVQDEVGGPSGLLGRRIGAGYWAAALVATGRLVPLEAGGDRPAGGGEGLRMACVVDRDGVVGWSTDRPRPGPLARPPEQGRMLDVLRRALGLATAPPPCPFARLEVTAWLLALVGAGSIIGGSPMSWEEAKALRPGRPGFGGRDTGGTWERYRARIASGAGGPVDADLAAWMDEGMLARWVLADLPGLEPALAAASPVLDADAARRLERIVDEVRRAGPVSTRPAPRR